MSVPNRQAKIIGSDTHASDLTGTGSIDDPIIAYGTTDLGEECTIDVFQSLSQPTIASCVLNVPATPNKVTIRGRCNGRKLAGGDDVRLELKDDGGVEADTQFTTGATSPEISVQITLTDVSAGNHTYSIGINRLSGQFNYARFNGASTTNKENPSIIATATRLVDTHASDLTGSNTQKTRSHSPTT